MGRRAYRGILLPLLVVWCAAFARAESAPQRPDQDPAGTSILRLEGAAGAPGFRADEILVKLRPAAPDSDAERISERLGRVVRKFRIPTWSGRRWSERLSGERSSGAGQLLHLKLGRSISVATALAVATADPSVEYAEPNYLVHALRTPNDPRYPLQWGLQNTGQSEGTYAADIRALKAWDRRTDCTSTVVALLDTGVDRTHPDLSGSLWTNTGEIPGNGIDDDGNGYVDDVHGWDFVNSDPDPTDDNFHGTHVAGILGASGNNGIGISGVCWAARILPLKILGADGSGTVSDAIAAIEYARQAGARIVNSSWGGDAYSQALQDAILQGSDAGSLFVAAAGNDGVDVPMYPAAYRGVLAVAATVPSDARAPFSNRGSHLGVAAPGVGIESTLPGSETAAMRAFGLPRLYGALDGTSMAAPFVSGIAALVSSARPELTGGDLRRILQQSADDLGPTGWDPGWGYGRVNADRALQLPGPPARLSEPREDEHVSGLLRIVGSAQHEEFGSYVLEVGTDQEEVPWIEIGRSELPAPEGSLLTSWETGSVRDGAYVFRLTVTDLAGRSFVDRVRVEVANVRISSPERYAEFRLGDTVTVTGSAVGTGFRSYVLEYGQGLSPDAWIEIGDSSGPVVDGALGEWDTGRLARDGYYTLRLRVEYATGKLAETSVPVYVEGSLHPGWPLRYANTAFPSSPAAADLDGDGRLELLVGANRATASPFLSMFAWTSEGRTATGWPGTTSSPYVQQSSPAVADLEGDGDLEVVIADSAGTLTVYGADGQVRWTRSLWAAGRFAGNAPSPSLVDLNGDGYLDIVVGSVEPKLFAFDRVGKNLPGWPLSPRLLGSSEAWIMGQAVGPLGGGSRPDVVFGTASGQVFAVDATGKPLPGWPIQLPAGRVYSPVLGDVDADGDLEVVTAVEGTNEMYVWHADGTVKQGWPTEAYAVYTASPALGDLDGDGRLEIVFNTYHDRVYVWHHDGTLAPGWPKSTGNDTHSSEPILADVDGDGRSEVVCKMNPDRNERIYAWRLDGSLVDGFPKQILPQSGWWLYGSPLVADLDHDGKLELAAASMWPDSALPGYGSKGVVKVWDLEAPHDPLRVEWGKFHHDARNSGLYSRPGTETTADSNPPPRPKRTSSGSGGGGGGCFARTAGEPFDGSDLRLACSGVLVLLALQRKLRRITRRSP